MERDGTFVRYIFGFKPDYFVDTPWIKAPKRFLGDKFLQCRFKSGLYDVLIEYGDDTYPRIMIWIISFGYPDIH